VARASSARRPAERPGTRRRRSSCLLLPDAHWGCAREALDALFHRDRRRVGRRDPAARQLAARVGLRSGGSRAGVLDDAERLADAATSPVGAYARLGQWWARKRTDGIGDQSPRTARCRTGRIGRVRAPVRRFEVGFIDERQVASERKHGLDIGFVRAETSPRGCRRSRCRWSGEVESVS
jgi:hypothetical protein